MQHLGTDLSYSAFSLQCKNRCSPAIMLLNYAAKPVEWGQGLGIRTFLGDRTFHELRAQLLGVGQELVSKTGLSWKYRDLKNSGLLSKSFPSPYGYIDWGC